MPKEEYKKFELNLTATDMVEMYFEAATGKALCPVCGFLLEFVPYSPETGKASFSFCPCCNTQFGWDDKTPPDAPGSALTEKWDELRRKWLDEDANADAACEQLLRIGVKIN